MGAVIMSLLVLLAVFTAAASPSISRRLTTRAISSLTVSGIMTAMAIVEIDHADHQDHLHNVVMTSIVGLAWCFQLLLALMSHTGRDVGRVTMRSSSGSSPPVSPLRACAANDGVASGCMQGELQGRSGRLRRARRMYVDYRSPNPPRHVVRTPRCTTLRMLDAMLRVYACVVSVPPRSFIAVDTPRCRHHVVLAIDMRTRL